MKTLTQQLSAELLRLALLPDDEIMAELKEAIEIWEEKYKS